MNEVAMIPHKYAVNKAGIGNGITKNGIGKPPGDAGGGAVAALLVRWKCGEVR